MKLIEYANVGEKVWHDTLDNGLNVFVLPKPGFNKSYAFFATNYGGSDRRFKLAGKWLDTPAGVAHFLEHKMFDTETGNALAEMSANGASPNAFTSSGITAYLFECTDKLFENLRIMLSFVTIPYFTEESVEKEQGIIGQEIRMVEDSPARAVYQNLMKALYTHNPVRDSVAGTVESIAEITAQTLYDCHEVFYNPSNMVLCVTGDVDPEKVLDTAREIVNGAAGEVPERDYGPDETLFPDKKLIEVNMEVAAPLYYFGSKLDANLRGTDYLRKLMLGELSCEILTGRSSPLYARLYNEGIINRNYQYGISDHPGGMVVLAGGESREPERVLDEVTKEAKRLADGGISDKLFSQLKKAAIGGYITSLDSMTMTCYSFAEGFFRGYSPFESLEVMQKITKDDVAGFLKNVFTDETSAMSIVRPIVR